jgi:hypothetical protein
MFSVVSLPDVTRIDAGAMQVTYGRADYVPWSERPLLHKLVDFPEMLKRVLRPIQPIPLDDVVRRVEHMWGISEDKITLEADQRVAQLFNNLYARRTSDPARHGYIRDLVYQYERDCKANRSLLMMSVDMVVANGNITVKASLFRSPGISYEDHRHGSDKATKGLLLAVLSFAKTLKDFEYLVKRVQSESIFSKNEALKDTATEHMKLLLIPCLEADVLYRMMDDRAERVR